MAGRRGTYRKIPLKGTVIIIKAHNLCRIIRPFKDLMWA